MNMARGNTKPLHDSLMDVTVTTHRAPQTVARNLGKISC
jgi:hypothetical protein